MINVPGGADNDRFLSGENRHAVTGPVGWAPPTDEWFFRWAVPTLRYQPVEKVCHWLCQCIL